MENVCIKCKTKPAFIKKRGLCKSCYMQARRKNILNETDSPWKIAYSSEMEFVKNFFEHKNWSYQPAIFRINSRRYEPDFYDGERNVFIEVAGSRQAFHNNKEMYQLFIKAFPHIKFEIRYLTGEIIPLSETEKGKYHIPSKRR